MIWMFETRQSVEDRFKACITSGIHSFAHFSAKITNLAHFLAKVTNLAQEGNLGQFRLI